MSDLVEMSGKVPLVELLRAVPEDYHATWENGAYDWSMAPLGSYCRQAADRIAQLEDEVERLRGTLRLAILNLEKLPTCALGTAYRDDAYIPRVGRWRVEAIIDAESAKVEVLPELIRNLRKALPKQSYYDGNGSRVARKSSDSVWPLRRANGESWSNKKEDDQ